MAGDNFRIDGRLRHGALRNYRKRCGTTSHGRIRRWPRSSAMDVHCVLDNHGPSASYSIIGWERHSDNAGAFTITILVFLVGTVVGWFAPTIDVLIVGRILQGFSAGIITPMVMVTMFQVFPPDKRGLAMGIYGSGVVLAPRARPSCRRHGHRDAFEWAFHLHHAGSVLPNCAGGRIVLYAFTKNAPDHYRISTGLAIFCSAQHWHY